MYLLYCLANVVKERMSYFVLQIIYLFLLKLANNDVNYFTDELKAKYLIVLLS